jgi:hypothetical protein
VKARVSLAENSSARIFRETRQGFCGRMSALQSEEICQTAAEGEEMRQARSREEIAVPGTATELGRGAMVSLTR